MSAKKTPYNHFTLNFGKKTIVGTQNSFNKAGKGYGPLYDELAALMEKHPTYGIEIKQPEKPAKPKQTYKGMNIPFIVDYLTAVKDYITLETVNEVIDYAGKMRESKYPLVKRVLFDAYKSFNYAEAKSCVDDYRYKQMLNSATCAKAKPTTDNNTVIGEAEENELKPVVNL